ncbi:MAG TPA: response regulator [Polyangiaceae bacterium]|nr:response regulator [Polyangiaceae bacterium]
MDTISPANSSPSLRVLLIENSSDDAESLRLELLAQGYCARSSRVETSAALQAALDQAEWDVVLCEDRLPLMTALSALAIVQRQGLDLPFIIVSDAIDERDAIELMRAGAHDFLFKHSLGKLAAVIERETREAALRAESRRLQQQLLLADRLSSIGMLAAGVAHEINNPLAYVLGNLEFVIGRLSAERALEAGEQAEVLEALGQAREGSRRISHITRDLKVFCRSGEDDDKDSVNVKKVMDSAINIAWNQIRHRARLVRDFERVPTVIGNQDRLSQVFLNLLVNATQALPDGCSAQNEINVRIRSKLGKVVIEVSDNGCGMTAEQERRAFEPFFTTKPRGVGTGIGLSICKNIITGMSGAIGCKSRPGLGTTFRVELPAQGLAALSTLPPSALSPAQVVRSRILFIDDEPALYTVVRRLLEEHEVVGYVDPREALQSLAHDAAYDVVFCDIMMPYMSGREFLKQIRAYHRELATKIVFMTGGAFNDPTQNWLHSLPNPPLEKPFEIRALHSAIARVADAQVPSGTRLSRRVHRAV